MGSKWLSVLVLVLVVRECSARQGDTNTEGRHKSRNNGYADALMKSILFFEGQRSGPLPSSQRMKWRKDSALNDGKDVGVDLVGGYYDAGDNVKYNLPMAFSTTLLSWGALEFGKQMGSELQNAENAIRWGTDFFLKSTAIQDKVFVQVGDPYSDHACWQRPEDMDTLRTAYAVDKDHPGSEVAAEIAAALASSSIVFQNTDPQYSQTLLNRAEQVFQFADTYRGNYNDSLGQWVCPFYCDFSGYEDELLWAAAWLYKATNKTDYLNYVTQNLAAYEATPKGGGTVGEFGWDNKHGGVNILMAVLLLAAGKGSEPSPFITNADKFVCTIVPNSPTQVVTYSPGGLMFKPGNSNMQKATALSFLLVVYARHLSVSTKTTVQCGGLTVNTDQLIGLAKKQVDYILGDNPAQLSYMVGYGNRFPQQIHHRGSTLPSIDAHPQHIDCHGGTPYFESKKPNPNLLTGAVVGGPAENDSYVDSRYLFVESEPTTYINAPLVGLLGFFMVHHGSSYSLENI